MVDSNANPDRKAVVDNVAGEDQLTPLHAAAANGHLACVRHLVVARASLHHRVNNSPADTVALQAHGWSHPVAQYLSHCKFWTPLMLAVAERPGLGLG